MHRWVLGVVGGGLVAVWNFIPLTVYALKGIYRLAMDERAEQSGSVMSKAFEVLVTYEFEDWYNALDETDADQVYRVVELLEAKGVYLGHPYSSQLKGTAHHLRELRVQSKGAPIRILYAFDPNRDALLILGGHKGGDDRWYEENIPKAEKLWVRHLEEIDSSDSEDT